MEVILPPRLKTPSASSRKTLTKDKRPISATSGTKSIGKSGKSNDKDDSKVKSLTTELEFIKNTLLQMVSNDKVNDKKVKESKKTSAKKKKAANSKAKCGQSGDHRDRDQKSTEHVRSSKVKKSFKDATWKNPKALKKMSASKRFQIVTYMDQKCAEWADVYKECKYEKGLLELRVEDLNAIQWDLQRRLDQTARDHNAFFRGKELDPSSPCGNRPPFIEDQDDPLTKKYCKLLVRNTRLSEKLRETKTEKESLLAETKAAITKLEERQAFFIKNQRQQKQLKQQNLKLKRSIREKNRLIEQIKEPTPIKYNLKSWSC